MAITVDYSTQPYTIEFKQADLTLVSGTRYQITVDFMWQLLREYSDGYEGMSYPITFRRIPATASTPAITEINDPVYQAQFEDGSYSVDIIDGNTNFRDVEVKNTVSVGTNNTTGFINPTFLESGLFSNQVTVSVATGVAGTTYTASGGIIGTLQFPSNNMADALTIAGARGIGEFHILGDITVDSGLNYTDYIFNGQGQNLSVLTVTSAANVINATFLNAEVTGTLDGDSRIDSCVITDLDFVSGIITNCMINSGTVTLGGSAVAHFIDCESGVPGVGVPIIDCGGSGQGLAMRGYNGGVKLINKTGTESVSIDLNSGQVRIDLTTVTDGTIVVRGVGKVVDDATGDQIASGSYGSMTLINETVGVEQIWEQIVEGTYTAKEAMRLYNAALLGKVSGGGTSTVTFRDTGDTKDRIVASVDASGNRASIVLDET